jgi:erythronate-4-phosphate dehydrogenase
VAQKARALGLRVLQNDPPRQRAEPENAAEFVSLETIRREADIVTFHVPLTKTGPDATVHLADRRFFDGLRPGAILINAARGPVVDTAALLAAVDAGVVRHAAIDTWEGEPACRADLLARVDIGTPHIAGHSFEGKVMGTVMVYREACRVLGVEPAWAHEPLMPDAPVPELTVEGRGRRIEEVLWDAVRPVYDVGADDVRFRAADAASTDRAGHFDRLRKEYPMRREFRYTRLRLHDVEPAARRALAELEFACI